MYNIFRFLSHPFTFPFRTYRLPPASLVISPSPFQGFWVCFVPHWFNEGHQCVHWIGALHWSLVVSPEGTKSIAMTPSLPDLSIANTWAMRCLPIPSSSFLDPHLTGPILVQIWSKYPLLPRVPEFNSYVLPRRQHLAIFTFYGAYVHPCLLSLRGECINALFTKNWLLPPHPVISFLIISAYPVPT